MAPSHTELFKRNQAYAPNHQAVPTIAEIEAMGAPPPKTCIITCVDPRIFPEQLLNLKMGEAFIFRTVAGHPQPVLHDILTLDAQSRGFEDLVLIYHTDCGAHYFDVPHIRSELLKADSSAGDEVSQDTFGTITPSIDEAVRADIEWLKKQSLMRKELKERIHGYIFDIKTGKLQHVK